MLCSMLLSIPFSLPLCVALSVPLSLSLCITLFSELVSFDSLLSFHHSSLSLLDDSRNDKSSSMPRLMELTGLGVSISAFDAMGIALRADNILVVFVVDELIGVVSIYPFLELSFFFSDNRLIAS